MTKIKIYKLSVNSKDKEFFLLKKLIKEHFTDVSQQKTLSASKRLIYVASSKDKIRRIKTYLRDLNKGIFPPEVVTIWQLFDLLYDKLPPKDRLPKHIITDAYANVIVRHILLKNQKTIFSTTDFRLSPETSDFFLEWLKNIKGYNLHLIYGRGEFKYREDGFTFDLNNKENRFNERLLVAVNRVFDIYENFLNDNNLVDEVDKGWWTIDHLTPSILKDYSFYIEHLSILRRVEQVLFKKIYKFAKDISLLDFDFPFPNIRFTTTGIVEGETSVTEITNKESPPSLVLFSFKGKEQEVENIAKKAKKLSGEKKVAIISPDITEYEKTFERVFPLYNITLPSFARNKLSEFAVVNTCLSIFEVINQQLKRKAVVSFLLSPYVKLLDSHLKKVLDITTRELMIASGEDWERLKETKEEEMGTVLRFTNELKLLSKKHGIAFLDSYLSLLNTTLNIEDQEDLLAYNKFVEFISSLKIEPMKSAITDFGLKDFQNILTSYTNTVTLKRTKVVNENFELLNIEEAGGMNFETVFLIGLVEGKLPKEPKHNPLFSEKLLEEMGFPTYDMLYTLSKFNFEGIVKSTEEVYCSYFEKDERGNVFLKSPFLQDIEESKDAKTDRDINTLVEWQMQIGEAIYQNKTVNESVLHNELKNMTSFIRDGIARMKDNSRLRNIKEILLSNTVFREYINQRIKKLSKGISAIALKTYSDCPYRFFLNYILHIGGLDEPEEGADSLIRGKVIHTILADFYRKRLNQVITPDLKNKWKTIEDIAVKVIDSMVPVRRDRIILKLEFIFGTENALLRRFLNYEVKNNLKNTVLDVEWEFTGREVYIERNGERLGLAGRIDRIDKNAENKFIVYDYKTGKRDSLDKNNQIQEGKSFQLPIYAYAVEKCIGNVSRIYYYTISNEGIFLDIREKINTQTLISNIFNLWDRIKSFDFEPTMTSDCQSKCPYSEICPETS